MNKYTVKFMLPGSAGLSDLIVEEEVEAFSYSTQATSGAGLVADFFEDKERMVPIAATFSHVLSIKKTGSPLTVWVGLDKPTMWSFLELVQEKSMTTPETALNAEFRRVFGLGIHDIIHAP